MRITSDAAQEAMKRSLTVLSRRQQATLNNIANVDTPGYKATEVPFHVELSGAMGRTMPVSLTNSAHLTRTSAPAEVKTAQTSGTSWRNDGNNVDIERELASLAETNLTYSAVAQQMSAKLRLMRQVISEGRSQ
ncbi:MAG: flagellar basal body rod protein FlgB [Dehalococcoidales bacterium]|nr:flagellar basal body rod protein FlgB [Dehalococcoidales bacterium]